MNISAVVLTKNEEKNIIGCLQSIAWCDEILIIDDNSEDKTVELAKKFNHKNIRIYTKALENDFSSQRNFGLKQAYGNWVFFIDADERVSETLAFELMQSTTQTLNPPKGFTIRRIDILFGKKLLYGESGNSKLLRFARKDAGVWKGKVHEKWIIKGEKVELKNPLFHYPHPRIDEFLREINFYTDIRAKELYEKGAKVSGLEIIAYPLGKFLQNMIIKQGFRDGMPGFISAIVMSFHSFLVRGKLWLLWDK